MKNGFKSGLFPFPLSPLFRALSLFVQGYVFGSRFARFEVRRAFLRPWLDSLGAVGAWLLVVLIAAAGVVLLWLTLWLAYDAGMTM